MNSPLSLIALFIAGLLGGALNAIAGGGSLISFPSLVAYGMLTVPANATNTAALWPGSIGGVLGFWQEVRKQGKLVSLLLVPSLLGGLLGAYVLVSTPESIFRRVVPLLVLFATLLFAARDWFTRISKASPEGGEEHISLVGGIWGILFQIAIATYGGYFGAGQSIMMMASLSIMGLRDLHRINGLKTALAVSVNGIALVFFSLKGIVVWELALIMGVGAVVGGYAAARLSKRVSQRILRAFVIAVGLVVSVWLFVKQ
jgi:uncharacterized membrane protein YfcA